MDDAVPVRDSERFRDLSRQLERVLDGHRAAGRDAVEILHHQEVDAVLATEVMERTDVRMIQRRDRTRFTLEALACERIAGHFRRQDLDRDRAIEPGVARFVDFPHPAGSDARPEQIRADTGALQVPRQARARRRRGRRRFLAFLIVMRVEQELHLPTY